MEGDDVVVTVKDCDNRTLGSKNLLYSIQPVRYGVAGFRIINKNKDFVSWQMGITYVINFPGKVADQYSGWNTNHQDGINAIAFPAVSYTRKFGKKY